MEKLETGNSERFDALLRAMLAGEAPSGRKKSSSDQSSDGAPDACHDETQTPPDTSEDGEG